MLEQNPLKISNSFTLTVISRASCNTIFLLITFRNDIDEISHFPWIDFGTPNQIQTGDTAVSDKDKFYDYIFNHSSSVRTLISLVFRGKSYLSHHLRIALSDTPYLLPISVKEVVLIKFLSSSLVIFLI